MVSHILVGTFDTPAVFTLAFDPLARSLEVVGKSVATGAHSWLSLSVSCRTTGAKALADQTCRLTRLVCTQLRGPHLQASRRTRSSVAVEPRS